MKKSLMIVLALLLICLSACGGDSGEKPVGSTSGADKTGGSTKSVTESPTIETTVGTAPDEASSRASGDTTESKPDATAAQGKTTTAAVTDAPNVTATDSNAQSTKESKDTNATGSYGKVGSNIAIGTTTEPEPGQTVNPLDVDGDGWMDVYV